MASFDEPVIDLADEALACGSNDAALDLIRVAQRYPTHSKRGLPDLSRIAAECRARAVRLDALAIQDRRVREHAPVGGEARGGGVMDELFDALLDLAEEAVDAGLTGTA